MNPLKYIFAPYRNEAGDEGGDTGGNDGGEGGDQGGVMQQSGAWGWNSDTPGEGDRPEYLAEKYKTVEDQAKAYPELASKMGKYGNNFGAPEGDYELNLPEGVEGEFDTESPLLSAIQKEAKDMGLSQQAFDRLLGTYIEHDLSMIESTEQLAERVASELGENGKQVISDTWQRLNQVLGPEDAKALDAVTGSAEAVKALNKLLQSEAVLPAEGGKELGQVTRDELRAMRFKKYPEGHPKEGREMYGDDPDHTAKVEGLYKELHPGEDRREVG